jgi:hypothetical protein
MNMFYATRYLASIPKKKSTLLFLVLIAALLSLLCGIISVEHGVDANWDLQNYHLYNPFALFHHRYLKDVQPAQIQSYFNPIMDIPFYALIRSINDRPRLIAFVMGLVHGLNLTALLLIAWHSIRSCFGDVSGLMRVVLTLVAVWIGATGAGSLPLVGTTMGDITSAMPMLWALYVVLRVVDSARTDVRLVGRGLFVAGLLAGLSVGAKLTMAPYAVALTATLITLPLGALLRGTILFLVGAFVGFVLTGGFHCIHMTLLFQNPLFPFMNTIFRSPYWINDSFRDTRFLPTSLIDGLAFPFKWALQVTPGGIAAELSFRDIRIALVLALAILLVSKLAFSMRRTGASVRIPSSARVLVIYSMTSYIIWLSMFAIYRYAITLEMLSGTLIVLAIGTLARPAWLLMVLAVAVACHRTTVPLEWGHLPFGDHYIEAHVPDLPPNTLIAIVGGDPVSLFVPFAREDSVWISLSSVPGQKNLLAEREHRLIELQKGPIMVLEAGATKEAEASTLEAFGLVRGPGDCQLLYSNLDTPRYNLCNAGKVRAAAVGDR